MKKRAKMGSVKDLAPSAASAPEPEQSPGLKELFDNVLQTLDEILRCDDWKSDHVDIASKLDGYLLKLTFWSQDIKDASITLPAVEAQSSHLADMTSSLLHEMLAKIQELKNALFEPVNDESSDVYTPFELAEQLGELISALTSQVTPFRSLRDLVADDGLVSLLHHELQSISDQIASRPASAKGPDEILSAEQAPSSEQLETEQAKLEEQPGLATNQQDSANPVKDTPVVPESTRQEIPNVPAVVTVLDKGRAPDGSTDSPPDYSDFQLLPGQSGPQWWTGESGSQPNTHPTSQPRSLGADLGEGEHFADDGQPVPHEKSAGTELAESHLVSQPPLSQAHKALETVKSASQNDSEREPALSADGAHDEWAEWGVKLTKKQKKKAALQKAKAADMTEDTHPDISQKLQAKHPAGESDNDSGYGGSNRREMETRMTQRKKTFTGGASAADRAEGNHPESPKAQRRLLRYEPIDPRTFGSWETRALSKKKKNAISTDEIPAADEAEGNHPELPKEQVRPPNEPDDDWTWGNWGTKGPGKKTKKKNAVSTDEIPAADKAEGDVDLQEQLRPHNEADDDWGWGAWGPRETSKKKAVVEESAATGKLEETQSTQSKVQKALVASFSSDSLWNEFTTVSKKKKTKRKKATDGNEDSNKTIVVPMENDESLMSGKRGHAAKDDLRPSVENSSHQTTSVRSVLNPDLTSPKDDTVKVPELDEIVEIPSMPRSSVDGGIDKPRSAAGQALLKQHTADHAELPTKPDADSTTTTLKQTTKGKNSNLRVKRTAQEAASKKDQAGVNRSMKHQPYVEDAPESSEASDNESVSFQSDYSTFETKVQSPPYTTLSLDGFEKLATTHADPLTHGLVPPSNSIKPVNAPLQLPEPPKKLLPPEQRKAPEEIDQSIVDRVLGKIENAIDKMVEERFTRSSAQPSQKKASLDRLTVPLVRFGASKRRIDAPARMRSSRGMSRWQDDDEFPARRSSRQRAQKKALKQARMADIARHRIAIQKLLEPSSSNPNSSDSDATEGSWVVVVEDESEASFGRRDTRYRSRNFARSVPKSVPVEDDYLETPRRRYSRSRERPRGRPSERRRDKLRRRPRSVVETEREVESEWDSEGAEKYRNQLKSLHDKRNYRYVAKHHRSSSGSDDEHKERTHPISKSRRSKALTNIEEYPHRTPGPRARANVVRDRSTDYRPPAQVVTSENYYTPASTSAPVYNPGPIYDYSIPPTTYPSYPYTGRSTYELQSLANPLDYYQRAGYWPSGSTYPGFPPSQPYGYPSYSELYNRDYSRGTYYAPLGQDDYSRYPDGLERLSRLAREMEKVINETKMERRGPEHRHWQSGTDVTFEKGALVAGRTDTDLELDERIRTNQLKLRAVRGRIKELQQQSDAEFEEYQRIRRAKDEAERAEEWRVQDRERKLEELRIEIETRKLEEMRRKEDEVKRIEELRRLEAASRRMEEESRKEREVTLQGLEEKRRARRSSDTLIGEPLMITGPQDRQKPAWKRGSARPGRTANTNREDDVVDRILREAQLHGQDSALKGGMSTGGYAPNTTVQYRGIL